MTTRHMHTAARIAAIFLLVPLASLGFEPKEKKIAKAAEAAAAEQRTDAWLRSGEGDGPLVYVEGMRYDFHKLLVAEIQRRPKISLRMTTREDTAQFTLVGDVNRRADLAESHGKRAGLNGAKHFANVSMVSKETGEVVWSCHEDDRNKFDFNSTGRTFRRVAERCVNHLVREITGK